MADERTPDVIVDFIFENGIFHIAVINIGDAPAYNVTVSFNRDISGLGGSKIISKMPLFQQLQFLPSQKKIATLLDTAASYFNRQQPTDIETTIRFADGNSKIYTNVIKHNLDIYRDIGYITPKAT